MNNSPKSDLTALLADIRACHACADLPLGPRPIVQASATARLRLIGQAPGTRVHATGVPWNDPSGVRLRDWLGLEPARFYDPALVAITPMGFCYPGRGKGGDLPPRAACAPLWQPALDRALPEVRLTLAIGAHALAWVLGPAGGASLSDRVRDWRRHLPTVIPLPHPSPRNTRWLAERPWFATDLLPALKDHVAAALAG
jgi:uracil-DNA glycosylase